MSKKYLVISSDDGTIQDERVISVFKKYGIKATFNINTGMLGKREELPVPAIGGKLLRSRRCNRKTGVKRLIRVF